MKKSYNEGVASRIEVGSS